MAILWTAFCGYKKPPENAFNGCKLYRLFSLHKCLFRMQFGTQSLLIPILWVPWFVDTQFLELAVNHKLCSCRTNYMFCTHCSNFTTYIGGDRRYRPYVSLIHVSVWTKKVVSVPTYYATVSHLCTNRTYLFWISTESALLHCQVPTRKPRSRYRDMSY